MESNTEFSNTAITTGFLWWLLRMARRFLCCCGQDNSDVQLSVEETGSSSVRRHGIMVKAEVSSAQFRQNTWIKIEKQH